MRSRVNRSLARASTPRAPQATVLPMSTARADEHDQEVLEGVVLSPEEEAALAQRLAETDENEKAGRLIPWQTVRAERGM